MKKILLSILLTVVALANLKAQQEFRFAYRLHPTLIGNLKYAKRDVSPPKVNFNLKGIIQRIIDTDITVAGVTTHETRAYVKFWPFVPPSKVINDYNDSLLYFTINWDGPRLHKDIPFKESQFVATNIFFKYFTDIRVQGGGILNANLTYLPWIWGFTRFYQSSLVQPRIIFGGMGPFVGFSNTYVSNTVYFNAGWNIVASFYGIQIIPALGSEFDNLSLSEHGKNVIHPFIGIGLGFKIINVSIGNQSGK